MFKQVLAASALAATAFAAQAATYDIGVLPIAPDTFVKSVSTTSPPGTFSDTFNFIAPTGSGYSGSGVAISLDVGSNILNIDDVTVKLFDAGHNLLATGSSGDSSGVTWQLLSGANYSFEVTGKTVGIAGGLYTFAATAALVPEPETLAMMLAGIGAVGFMARRRRPE